MGTRLEHESGSCATCRVRTMSWPIDEDGAPITYVAESKNVHETVTVWRPSNVWQGTEYGLCWVARGSSVRLTEENLGIVWARGWGTKEANALRTANAL